MDRNGPSPTGIIAAELRYVLCLTARAGDIERLKRLHLLKGGRLAPHRITATYYDTPAFELKERALALSVRQEGNRVSETLETLQQPSGNGERPLWQVPLIRPRPDLTSLAEIDGIGDLVGRRLRPVFEFRLRRNRIVLEPDGGTVAVSFDEGSLRARNSKSEPLNEIELELEQGHPRALFSLAAALNTAAHLRLELRSKAVRGHDLASRGAEGPPATQRFGRVELKRHMPAEEALAVILKRCLTHLLANDHAALDCKEEGVHQMRVALRRLRVALKLFKPLLPDEDRNWATGEVKWVAGTLGNARNWDVFLTLIADIQKTLPNDRDLETLKQAAQREREVAYDAVRRVLTARRYTAFALRLTGWVETRSWRRPGALETAIRQVSIVGKLADTVLQKRFKRARKFARSFDMLDAEGRHEFRIALKNLRYAADSFGALYSESAVRSTIKHLQGLQDDLGVLNDIATSEQLIARLTQRGSQSVARGAAVVRGWSGRIAAETEPHLAKRVKELRKVEPFWHEPN